MVLTWMLYGYAIWLPHGYHMAGIWFTHMEYIWALGCKPHQFPYASHMTSHMVYILVTYDNAIGATASHWKLFIKEHTIVRNLNNISLNCTRCREWFQDFWSAKLRSAFYPHVRTCGPQILVRVIPIDGPQVRILHVAIFRAFMRT